MPAEERCMGCRYCRATLNLHDTFPACLVPKLHCTKEVVMSYDECPLFTPSEEE